KGLSPVSNNDPWHLEHAPTTSEMRNLCGSWHEMHTRGLGGPAVWTSFAFSEWQLPHTPGAGRGFSCGLWHVKQLFFACDSGPSRTSCVSSVEWHRAHDVLVSSGFGECGLWHDVQSLWRSGASAPCLPFVSEWHFRHTAPLGGGPCTSWQSVHALCSGGLRVWKRFVSSLWHCMHPLRSAFHVCGRWQLVQLLCFSAVLRTAPSPTSPLAFFSWQSTQRCSAVLMGRC